VQIEQDRSGVVKEITLKQCNGDARWQLSLVRAIESASPLPAPPDPSVFAKVLTVEMGSEPFAASSGAGFEPAPVGIVDRGDRTKDSFVR